MTDAVQRVSDIGDGVLCMSERRVDLHQFTLLEQTDRQPHHRGDVQHGVAGDEPHITRGVVVALGHRIGGPEQLKVGHDQVEGYVHRIEFGEQIIADQAEYEYQDADGKGHELAQARRCGNRHCREDEHRLKDQQQPGHQLWRQVNGR